MNKKVQKVSKTICVSGRDQYRTPKGDTSIASISTFVSQLEEAETRIQLMEKMHKWRRERRLKRLEDTYNENCRLFFSINNQRSLYGELKLKIGLSSNSKRSPNKRNETISSRRYENSNETTTKKSQTCVLQTSIKNKFEIDEQSRKSIRNILREKNLTALDRITTEPAKKVLTENSEIDYIGQKANENSFHQKLENLQNKLRKERQSEGYFSNAASRGLKVSARKILEHLNIKVL